MRLVIQIGDHPPQILHLTGPAGDITYSVIHSHPIPIPERQARPPIEGAEDTSAEDEAAIATLCFYNPDLMTLATSDKELQTSLTHMPTPAVETSVALANTTDISLRRKPDTGDSAADRGDKDGQRPLQATEESSALVGSEKAQIPSSAALMEQIHVIDCEVSKSFPVPVLEESDDDWAAQDTTVSCRSNLPPIPEEPICHAQESMATKLPATTTQLEVGRPTATGSWSKAIRSIKRTMSYLAGVSIDKVEVGCNADSDRAAQPICTDIHPTVIDESTGINEVEERVPVTTSVTRDSSGPGHDMPTELTDNPASMSTAPQDVDTPGAEKVSYQVLGSREQPQAHVKSRIPSDMLNVGESTPDEVVIVRSAESKDAVAPTHEDAGISAVLEVQQFMLPVLGTDRLGSTEAQSIQASAGVPDDLEQIPDATALPPLNHDAQRVSPGLQTADEHMDEVLWAAIVEEMKKMPHLEEPPNVKEDGQPTDTEVQPLSGSVPSAPAISWLFPQTDNPEDIFKPLRLLDNPNDSLSSLFIDVYRGSLIRSPQLGCTKGAEGSDEMYVFPAS